MSRAVDDERANGRIDSTHADLERMLYPEMASEFLCQFLLPEQYPQPLRERYAVRRTGIGL